MKTEAIEMEKKVHLFVVVVHVMNHVNHGEETPLASALELTCG
jgi:hypothetical protein